MEVVYDSGLEMGGGRSLLDINYGRFCIKEKEENIPSATDND